MSQVTTSAIHTDDSKTTLGFWIYLMTDCMLFAALFATFIILRGNVFGGPAESELYHMPFVLAETLILLTSSFTCGLAMMSLHQKQTRRVITLLGATFVLGIAFLTLELNEFSDLIREGHSFTASASLSAFFTLVGTHGLHITIGLIWLVVLFWQLLNRGITRSTARRLTLFSMFWHFLDVIWIFIFTIVYLMGGGGLV
jgi:cytochrome o ubiquinol oxidase subunit 3